MKVSELVAELLKLNQDQEVRVHIEEQDQVYRATGAWTEVNNTVMISTDGPIDEEEEEEEEEE